MDTRPLDPLRRWRLFLVVALGILWASVIAAVPMQDPLILVIGGGLGVIAHVVAIAMAIRHWRSGRSLALAIVWFGFSSVAFFGFLVIRFHGKIFGTRLTSLLGI